MSCSHQHSWIKKDIKTAYQTKNHRLMMKAGLIFQTAAGIYSWLPHGLKALQKLRRLCQKYLKRIDCREVMMPHILSTELLKQSGRLHAFGADMLLMQDRKGHALYFGPTHEEPIVHFMQSYLHTYKQLPQVLYQIQDKFRDELRPRGGVIRSREFLMLDAYSFHANKACLQQTYQRMKEAFEAILQALALQYVIAQADSGAIGGEFSEELQIISPIGENVIFLSSAQHYAANIETAIYDVHRPPAQVASQLVSYYFTNGTAYVQVILGNLYTPNGLKIKHLLQGDYRPIAEEHVNRLQLKVLYDHSVKGLLAEGDDHWVDVRNVIDGDYAIDGGVLASTKSIEVGHIFDLGTYYATQMKLEITTQHNQATPVIMGCYGLGLSRLLGVCIEMHSTAEEIRWPHGIQPYDLALIPLGKKNDAKAQLLYETLHTHGDKDIFFSSGGSDASNLKNARILGCPYLLLIKDESYVLQKLDQTQEQVIPATELATLLQLLETVLAA